MTLLEYSYQPHINRYWVADKLDKFFKVYPQFKDATIIQEVITEYNFDVDYKYNDSWVVQLKGRLYNVLINISSRNWSRGRKQQTGVKFKRLYLNGKTPTRVRKNKHNINYEPTCNSVQVSKSFTKRNDCQIWTLAKCLEISYEKAYEHLSANGWSEKNPRNQFLNRWDAIFILYGKEIVDYWSKFASNTDSFKGISVGRVIEKLPSTGTFIVTTCNHILCVVNGTIFDSAFKPNAHVNTIQKVI